MEEAGDIVCCWRHTIQNSKAGLGISRRKLKQVNFTYKLITIEFSHIHKICYSKSNNRCRLSHHEEHIELNLFVRQQILYNDFRSGSLHRKHSTIHFHKSKFQKYLMTRTNNKILEEQPQAFFFNKINETAKISMGHTAQNETAALKIPFFFV